MVGEFRLRRLEAIKNVMLAPLECAADRPLKESVRGIQSDNYVIEVREWCVCVCVCVCVWFLF